MIRRIFHSVKDKIRSKKTLHLEQSTQKGELNPFDDYEGEKQALIWNAFGVDYSREIQQLVEARDAFLMQLNSSVMTDDLKEFIESVVRDEVKRILKKGELNEK